jgi:phage terminase large subunit-like protein
MKLQATRCTASTMIQDYRPPSDTIYMGSTRSKWRRQTCASLYRPLGSHSRVVLPLASSNRASTAFFLLLHVQILLIVLGAQGSFRSAWGGTWQRDASQQAHVDPHIQRSHIVAKSSLPQTQQPWMLGRLVPGSKKPNHSFIKISFGHAPAVGDQQCSTRVTFLYMSSVCYNSTWRSCGRTANC